jgi:hypothetical protein
VDTGDVVVELRWADGGEGEEAAGGEQKRGVGERSKKTKRGKKAYEPVLEKRISWSKRLR